MSKDRSQISWIWKTLNFLTDESLFVFVFPLFQNMRNKHLKCKKTYFGQHCMLITLQCHSISRQDWMYEWVSTKFEIKKEKELLFSWLRFWAQEPTNAEYIFGYSFALLMSLICIVDLVLWLMTAIKTPYGAVTGVELIKRKLSPKHDGFTFVVRCSCKQGQVGQ